MAQKTTYLTIKDIITPNGLQGNSIADNNKTEKITL